MLSTRFCFAAAALVAAAAGCAAFAASPPMQVQVQSAYVDGNAVTVTLYNSGSKPALAWTVAVRQLDASGAPLKPTPVVVGFDYVFSQRSAQAAARDELLPGAEKTVQVASEPNAVSATATLLAVVYADRTAEGDPKQIGMFFQNRARFAKSASDAANLLATPPSSDSDRADKIAKLSQMKLLAHSATLLAHGQSTDWATAAAEQKALADYITAQAQLATGGTQQ